jgi:hypothetical protein
MRLAVSRLLVVAALVFSLPLLQGCSWGYTTWKDKSISATGSSGGMEISTSKDVAKIVLGSHVILLRDDSVSVDGLQREVRPYKKASITEKGGRVTLLLDGKAIF